MAYSKEAKRRLFRYRRERLYIALESVKDADFIWHEREVNHFDVLWNMDMSLKDIAEQFDRSETSIFLLALDRALQGKIKARKGWKIW